MAGGAQKLAIVVAPDSGTGGLAGIAGSFHLEIVDGKHLYEFS